MTNVATLERSTRSKRAGKLMDTEDIAQILDRLEKLSKRPDNPGMAYRNLETINALINTLRERLDQSDAIG